MSQVQMLYATETRMIETLRTHYPDLIYSGNAISLVGEDESSEAGDTIMDCFNWALEQDKHLDAEHIIFLCTMPIKDSNNFRLFGAFVDEDQFVVMQGEVAEPLSDNEGDERINQMINELFERSGFDPDEMDRKLSVTTH
jgi:hypothetical protein